MVSSTWRQACSTPLPPNRSSPSRRSTASNFPVDAPEGTAARPAEPSSHRQSTSTVGSPRESRTSRAVREAMAGAMGVPSLARGPSQFAEAAEQLLVGEAGQVDALQFRPGGQRLEALGEPPGAAAQGALGVDPALAGH